MPVSKKVRIYDLSKEVKQGTKRIIEELRREGANVSVPSNSVSKELADRIRDKYFPKVEKTPKRTIKVIKKRKIKQPEKPVEDETTVLTKDGEEKSREEKLDKRKETPTEEKSKEKELKRDSRKIIKLRKKTPQKLKEERTEKEQVAEISPEVKGLEVKEKKEKKAETAKEVNEIAKEQKRTGTRIKRLKLTKDALQAGLKPGERISALQPTREELKTKSARVKKKDRKGFEDERRKSFQGTPGETATPKTVYTPPPSRGRKLGRRGRKGVHLDDKNKFQEREVEVPRKRSIEERIFAQIGYVDKDNLKPIRLTEGATIREFAEGVGVIPRDIVQLLVKRGVFATLNQPIGEEIAIELGREFGCAVSFVPFEEMVIEQEFEDLIASDADDEEMMRAPVVTVMGHVDHGKTSLLDAIRSANVAEGEAGGITQHIGAYSVYVPNAENPKERRRVVFLDTPGHEAFTMMRARGAKATDIVVLVVAADDGVMPQTVEAIEHSKAAKVPIIVAINKIDKPNASTDKVKKELALNGLNPIEWGGDIEMVPVSAIKHENLNTLLETVLLSADILELKASPTRQASGVVLEAKLDKGRGSVATVLIQQGTLNIGDPFIVGQFYGRVRAMFSDRGEKIDAAPPSIPVEVLGLHGVPQAGDVFQAVSNIDRAQTIANQRQMQARQIAMLKTTKRGIESLGLADVKELLIVLKADVQGSVEVLRATLEKLSTEKVKVRVIRSGVGTITETDVLLASATQAEQASTAVVIIGFNVRPGTRAVETAKQEGVDVRLHSVIYKVEEEIRAAMIGMLDAIEKEIILGRAIVQETYKVSKVGMIAGCRITDGLIKRPAKGRLIRDGVVIWTGDIASLKRFKDDVNEVKQGFECGMSLFNFNDIKVDDEIEAFVIEKIAATEL